MQVYLSIQTQLGTAKIGLEQTFRQASEASGGKLGRGWERKLWAV